MAVQMAGRKERNVMVIFQHSEELAVETGGASSIQ